MRRNAEWRKKRGKKALTQWTDKPRLFEDLLPLWSAWSDLSNGRAIGMAPGGLPWSECSRYCEDHGVHGEQRRRWCRLLVRMDAAYLSEMSKREKPDADSRAIHRRNESRAGRKAGRDRAQDRHSAGADD